MVQRLLQLDVMPVQDRDLLTRLTLYFDALETRLAQGQGWFIFNAGGQRAAWLTRVIQARLNEYRPLFSFYIMPWRDFALNAYVTEVELPGQRDADGADAPPDVRARELRLAAGISMATGFQMRQCDLLVVTGLRPSLPHEVHLLDETLARRYQQRRATVLVAPESPNALAARLGAIAGGEAAWQRLWAAAYERNLIAL